MERAEVSKRNKYYISKHRYYELKHFCLQYNEWKQAIKLLNAWDKNSSELSITESKRTSPSNPTEKIAIARVQYSRRIDLVDNALSEIDPYIQKYLKIGVTEGITYDILRVKGCPCCRDYYYDEYRKFFWILDTRKE